MNLRKEISAGGVVVYRNRILLLRRFNNDWVLPKGRKERGEELVDTALREVLEETGVKGEIKEYIGKINYKYRTMYDDLYVDKTVHWFLMKAINTNTAPQRTEGFKEAVFIQKDRTERLLKYKSERIIIKKAFNYME